MLNAACTGSNCQSVPGTRAPLVKIAPGTTGPKMLGAFGIAQSQQAAAEGVDQIVARGVDGFAASRDVARGIVGEFD